MGTHGFPWWNDTVFYEVFVRSFYDSDGDGIGDLKGLISKLDYLNDGDPATQTDLGVNGLWLMPIQPSPSYHGYDVTDYYQVNPEYGTLEDFKELIDAAHQRGIRIIIDLVLNHTSIEHPWFVSAEDPASEKRDWYVWSDTDPGILGPWGERAWHKLGNAYYYGVFWDRMPDLNYRNPAVSAEMEKVVRFWLAELGADGFRVDGAKHLIEEGENQINTKPTHEWFKQFRTVYKGINPQVITVGEVRDSIFAAAPYARGDEFDLVFDFDLASAILNGVNGVDGEKIQNAISFTLSKYKPGQFATLLTNHDDPRVMTHFQADIGKMKNAATIYLTMPGVPFLYYGEEIGMQGTKPDELIRTPMHWSAEAQAGFTTGTPWEPVRRDYQEVNLASQADLPDSLWTHYRSLLALRNSYESLRVGEYIPVQTGSNEIYAALRQTEDQTILILVNLSDDPVQDPLLSADVPNLRGSFSLQSLMGEVQFADLTTGGEKEGFVDYQPVREIPAHANLVFMLTPKP